MKPFPDPRNHAEEIANARAQAKTPFHEKPPATQAGILCGGDMFQRFAAERAGLPTDQCTASAAAEYLRLYCGVNSRRDLNTAPAELKPAIMAVTKLEHAMREAKKG